MNETKNQHFNVLVILNTIIGMTFIFAVIWMLTRCASCY